MKIAFIILAVAFIALLMLVASVLAAAAQDQMCRRCKHLQLCNEMEKKKDPDFIPPCFLERMRKTERIPDEPIKPL